jgi:hypothetical protein
MILSLMAKKFLLAIFKKAKITLIALKYLGILLIVQLPIKIGQLIHLLKLEKVISIN